MTTDVESWFHQLPNDEDTANPAEKKALKDFLAGSTSAEIAAERLTATIAGAENPEEELPRIWSFVTEAAEHLPDAQDRLVALLKAIKQLPDLERNGDPVTVYGNMTVWKDLPLLANELRDRWEYNDGPKTPEKLVRREEWVNLNAFLARITAGQVVDLKHMAIWTLRSALEDEPWDKQVPGAIGSLGLTHQTTIDILEGLVPGAVQWILQAGRVIHDAEDDYGTMARGGDVFTGKEGFSRERWDLWMTRFRWVQERSELDQQTRDLAGKAAEVMASI